MNQIILNEISRIEKEMFALEFQHLYYNRTDWQVLKGQKEILEKILKADRRKLKIALLKDNQDNWDMGLLTREQYEKQIEKIGK